MTEEERLTILTLSQSLGVLGHDIGNIVAIMGLRLAQIEMLQKKGQAGLTEPVLKQVNSLKSDLARFDSTMSGMSQLSAATDTRSKQDVHVQQLLSQAREIEPIDLLVDGIQPNDLVRGDPFQLKVMLAFLFRYGHLVSAALPPQAADLKAVRSEQGYQLTLSFKNVNLSSEQCDQVFKPFITMPGPGHFGVEASVAYRIAQKNGLSLNLNDEFGYLCFVLTFS